MDREQIAIKLQRAPEDPAENDPKFQEELSEFSKSLRTAGVTFAQRGRAFDAIDAHGYALAEYTIKQLAPVVVPAVTGAIGIWLQARYGRKVRIKIGPVEAEARTIDEIDKLLKRAADFQISDSTKSNDA
jgi:hypothetical protein